MKVVTFDPTQDHCGFGPTGARLSKGASNNQLKPEKEWWVARRLIIAMARAGMVRPHLISQELPPEPDFVISCHSAETIDLEITEATTTEDKREVARAMKVGGVWSDGAFGGRGSGGYFGDQDYVDWLSDVKCAVARKQKFLLSDPRVNHLKHLCIYTNSNPGFLVSCYAEEYPHMSADIGNLKTAESPPDSQLSVLIGDRVIVVANGQTQELNIEEDVRNRLPEA